MAGKLSFAIAINLLTENFKRGTSSVKNGLRSMQMQVLTFAAALGAGGIGLTDFVTRLIDVARETSRVTTALKNVSGGMGQFADNQRFLLDIAKKYGLEINALTGNFAKFTAASQVSGMSMANQRKIFESVSRACTAFGMSADDSNGVFLALSQMMSKGKISSEELRLQMGERLPIALQAMAKAAGVSVGELDKLMKQGKLMSKDVLPGFADALNEMIPNVDTDNIETSVNRLKNAFTKFANGTGVQNAYKGIIDWLTGAVNGLQGKISSAIAFVIALISGKLLGSVVSYFGQFWKLIDTTISRSKTAEAQKLLLTQQRIEAEKVYESTLTNFNTTENGKRLASKRDLNKAEKVMDSARVAEKKAMLTAETAAEKAAAVSSSSVWGKTMNTLKLGFTQLGRTLKGVFAAAWPMILITAISAIIAKLVSAYSEAKRVKGIFADYQKNLWNSGNTAEVTRMQVLVNVMNDRKKSQNEINAAQSELQRMIGKENLSQEALNKLVKTRIALLREAAMAEAAYGTVGEYSEKNAKLAVDAGLSTDQMDRLASLYPGSKLGGRNEEYYREVRAQVLKESGSIKVRGVGDFDRAIKEYAQNSRVINDATSRAGKYQESANKINTLPGGGTPDKKESALQKAEEKYAQSIRELDAKVEIEKLSKNEYNKALDELNASMYIDAKGSGDKQVLESKYLQNLQKAVANPLYSKGIGELEELHKKYAEEEGKLTNQLKNKQLTEKEYQEELRKLLTETSKAAGAISGVELESQAFIAAMQFNAKWLTKKPDMPKMESRDKTFDYKKSKADIAGEELDVAKRNLDKLKETAKGNVEQFSKELNAAMQNVTDLEQALKIATVIEDVKKLREELSDGIYSGMKDVASSADRLVSSFQNLDEVFDPESEASGWERLMAVWSAMTNAIDSFLSICKMVENLTELTNKLALAQQTEAAINTTTTAVKVANAGTETTAELTALGTQTTAEAAASATKATAASVEMAAKSTAAYAAIPFVGVGLAAAQIVAMQAMIAAAAIPKFETGGIFMGGTASGDKGLARLNKGEMILNLGQQSRLFEAINSGRMGNDSASSLSVATKIRSKDLILIINNELKSQGKKPIS